MPIYRSKSTFQVPLAPATIEMMSSILKRCMPSDQARDIQGGARIRVQVDNVEFDALVTDFKVNDGVIEFAFYFDDESAKTLKGTW